jgi:hypothetical protein
MSKSQIPPTLLALLDASSTPEAPASDTFADLSETLQTLLWQYTLNTLDEATPEADTLALEEQLVPLIAQEPRGLLMLRALLRDVAAVEELGPVPAELMERQTRQLSRFSLPKPADFTVSLSKGQLRYTGRIPTRTTQSFQLARDANEGTTVLQHTQRLNHCEVEVTIEAAAHQTFSMVIHVTFIDPQFARQPLEVRLSDSTASVLHSQPVRNKSVEFENLPAGSYTLQILAAGNVMDQFEAELNLDDPS